MKPLSPTAGTSSSKNPYDYYIYNYKHYHIKGRRASSRAIMVRRRTFRSLECLRRRESLRSTRYGRRIICLFGSPKKDGLAQPLIYRLLQQQKQQEWGQPAMQLAIESMKPSLIPSLHFLPYFKERQAHRRRSNRCGQQRNP